MLSLALWPVAWAIGHTGTISLYNALISLIAGTSQPLLPFAGMFASEGYFNRQAAQSFVMHMLRLRSGLWHGPSATRASALYNALISLIAGTSRVPDIVGILQWNSITTVAPSEAQVQATEAALGNWFMGNLTALLSILVGGVGFVLWVVIVSILGPAFLHKLLATGMMFMTQAAGSAARQAAVAGKLAVSAAQSAGIPGVFAGSPPAGERLAAANPAEGAAFLGFGGHGSAGGAASMQGAARFVDDSGGKNTVPM